MLDQNVASGAVFAGRLPRAGARSSAVPKLFAVAAFGLVAIAMGLSLPTSHDEYQYLAAAHLYAKARMYSEFFYSQTPYFPVALSSWLEATRGLVPSAYVSARLFNIAWSLVYIGALFHVLFRLSPSWVFAAAVGAALLSGDIMHLPLRTARNDMMPLALATGAVALVVRACWLDTRARGARAVLHLLAGVLIAAAVGTKQSYAFVAAAAALYSVASPHLPPRERLLTQFLPLAAGGGLGALPMLALVAASPENFLYAALEFHQTHHLWWSARTPDEHGAISSLYVRAYVLFRTLATAPHIVLALVFAACVGVWFLSPRRAFGPEERRLWSVLLLAGGTVLAAIPVFIMPKPLHAQYVAPMLPFVGVCAAAGAALACRTATGTRLADGRRWLLGASVLLLASTAIYGAVWPKRGPLAHVRYLAAATVRGGGGHWVGFGGVWVAEHAQRVEARLREVLGPPDGGVRVATTMNIYPVGAGYGIHPELASAPFFYQTNDLIPPALVHRLVGTSPALAPEWLARSGARAVLVGYMQDLDAPLREHARRESFLCFRVDLRGGQSDWKDAEPGELWVAPDLARAAPDCAGNPPGRAP